MGQIGGFPPGYWDPARRRSRYAIISTEKVPCGGEIGGSKVKLCTQMNVAMGQTETLWD